jgi:hypothetical protein
MTHRNDENSDASNRCDDEMVLGVCNYIRHFSDNEGNNGKGRHQPGYRKS